MRLFAFDLSQKNQATASDKKQCRREKLAQFSGDVRIYLFCHKLLARRPLAHPAFRPITHKNTLFSKM